MILTERLHIEPINYYELLSKVYSYYGIITNNEEQKELTKAIDKEMMVFNKQINK